MPVSVLITRPQAQSQTLQQALHDMGFATSVEPLLEITAVSYPPIDWGAYAGIILTSANGARFLSPGAAHLPCVCIGVATVQAARAYGFRDIRVCGANSAAILAHLGRHFRLGAHLLYLSGMDVHVDLVAALPNYTIARVPVYQAQMCTQFSPLVITQFYRQHIQHVFLFSHRTACAFVQCVQAAHVDLAPVRLYGLSRHVTDPCQSLTCRDILIPEQPTQEAMLELLREIQNV